jgi:hypothetical protein
MNEIINNMKIISGDDKQWAGGDRQFHRGITGAQNMVNIMKQENNINSDTA